jgi:hypothetical protein
MSVSLSEKCFGSGGLCVCISVACALVRECFGDIFVDCALEVGGRRFAEAGLCIRIFVGCVVKIGK